VKKKILALVLAVATIMSLSIPVLAAPSDANITSVTLGGVAADIGATNTTISSVVKGSVTLTTAQAASAASVITLDDGVSFKAAKVAETDVATIDASNLTSVTQDTEVSATTWATGDALFIGVDDEVTYGDSGSPTYYIIVVTVSDGGGGTDTGSIDGDSIVNDVIFEVDVPTDINFAIDPFELGISLGGGQITGTSYNFLNSTKAPVKVLLDFTTDLTGGGAALVADPSALSPDDDSVIDKKLYFAVLGAKTLAATANTVSAVAYDKTEAGTLVPFGTDGKASAGFVLAASSDGTEVLAPGMGSFTFYGVLNTYADWEAGDVKVTAAYTLVALRPATYTALSTAAVGANKTQLASTSSVLGFIGESVPTTKTITKASITDTQLSIPFNFGDKTITSIKLPSGTSLAVDQYEKTVGALVFSASRTTALKGLTVNVTYTITLSDTSVYTLTITV
jgi:hypothetical protein